MSIDARQAMSITYSLHAGMALAHSRKVIHRDLEPDMILLGKTDLFWKAVIADFGNFSIMRQKLAASGACAAASDAHSVARWAGSGRALSRNVCTHCYGHSVDVWSLGGCSGRD